MPKSAGLVIMPAPHPLSKEPALNAITVYSKPNCVQCNATYRLLDKLGLEYTLVDVSKDETAYKYVTETLGHQQVPVVVTEDDNWHGFVPDKLNALAVNK